MRLKGKVVQHFQVNFSQYYVGVIETHLHKLDYRIQVFPPAIFHGLAGLANFRLLREETPETVSGLWSWLIPLYWSLSRSSSSVFDAYLENNKTGLSPPSSCGMIEREAVIREQWPRQYLTCNQSIVVFKRLDCLRKRLYSLTSVLLMKFRLLAAC